MSVAGEGNVEPGAEWLLNTWSVDGKSSVRYTLPDSATQMWLFINDCPSIYSMKHRSNSSLPVNYKRHCISLHQAILVAFFIISEMILWLCSGMPFSGENFWPDAKLTCRPLIYRVERSTKTIAMRRKKQVICNFNKCSFCAMAGLKPDSNSSEISFFSKKEHSWADTTFSKKMK